KHLFLHRSSTSSHYDLIQLRDPKDINQGYIFVAFNINPISEILHKYQLPFQQLFLLRNDKKGFIEVSTEQTSGLLSTEYLSEKALSDFEYALEIPDTRWSFAIRLDPQTKSEIFNTALQQSFTTWSVVTILLYFAFHLIRKNLQSKHQTELELRRSQQQANTIVNSVNESVFSVDSNHKVTFANERARSMLGLRMEQILGQAFSEICHLYNHEAGEKKYFADILKAFQNNEISECCNLTLMVDEQTNIPVAVKLAPILSVSGKVDGYTITLEDLTTAVELGKRLIFHESRDSLTGLINRRQLEKELSSILGDVKGSAAIEDSQQSISAIVLIDLDKFQILNTSYGFEAGDEFLKRVAILLRQNIDQSHKLSRLSSDEFAVIASGIEEPQLELLCDQIKNAFKSFEFSWQEEVITTSACLGVVIIDAQFENTNQILAAADHACRLAKTKGTNVTQYYLTDDPDIKRRAEEITRHADLEKAIAENRFAIYRQAIIPTQPSIGTPKKYELLIRMLDHSGNIVPPGLFIPVAEKYGLMAKIDRWVLDNTFRHLSTLKEEQRTIYNVNLSSITLTDKKISEFVDSLFNHYKINPQDINFEITETSAISYLENALEFMHNMKSRGCTFSLDDFGTGLASFDYLKKLPIDFLKIDGLFVKDIEHNPIDFAFIEAIQKISSQMGIKTVAEYVESEVVFELLKGIGVDFAQGYYIEKPQPWLQPEKN
ncbi:MAG: EAL domain-containing protein, partial [Kangiellaceae bacterium]|nr:EAL domain-containing protein [Kangiellaceae bacterium]